MPRTVAISELKARCLRLVDDVARRRHEIVVTRRGKPVARLVPFGGPNEEDPVLAQLRGTLVGGNDISDFETGLEWEAMRR
jgi:prevent-host-death family protein